MTSGRSVVVRWMVLVVIVGATAWWAGRATLDRPEVPAAPDEPVLYTVLAGAVGQSQSFTASAHWPETAVATNAAPGVVTSVDLAGGAIVQSGQRLYSVNLRPVVVAAGEIPSFRDLAVGARGADVQQLETFLVGQVEFTGTVDAEFTSRTAAAVRAWQTALGIAPDGLVRRGDIVFVPSLPARITLGTDFRVGAEIGPGTGTVALLGDAPRFSITLSTDQQDLVPLSASVEIEHPDGVWTAVIDSVTDTAEGELEFQLSAPDGAAICGADCGDVPVGAPTLFRAQVIVVPETSGPEVPVAALRSHPDGSVSVVAADGSEIPITILATGDARAIVDGLEVGAEIRLFADEPATDVSEPTPSP